MENASYKGNNIRSQSERHKDETLQFSMRSMTKRMRHQVDLTFKLRPTLNYHTKFGTAVVKNKYQIIFSIGMGKRKSIQIGGEQSSGA